MVTMSAVKSVSVTFTKGFVLSITKSGSGSGTVRGSGVECGADCSEGYASGKKVTLTALASAGSKFAGWGGACSGTGGCTLTMSKAQTVRASFDLAAVCGNGVPEAGEQCDDGNVLVEGCAYGEISCMVCGPSCQNVPGAPVRYCGDGFEDDSNGEECDAGVTNGQVCTAAYGSTCSYCTAECKDEDVQGPSCGDDIVNGVEQCDGTDLGVHQCTTIGQNFVSGVLGCLPQCTFDVSSCVLPGDLEVVDAYWVDAAGAPVTSGNLAYVAKPVAVVKNIGLGPANDFTVRISVRWTASNGVKDMLTEVSPLYSLGPGEEQVVDFSEDYTFTELGDFNIQVNAEKVTGEINDQNNIKSTRAVGALGATSSTIASKGMTIVAVCGDGAVNTAAEQCDNKDSNGDVCTADYGETCSYCTTECKNEDVQGPYCGDNTQNGLEVCDEGSQNTDAACVAAYGGTGCTYCTLQCEVKAVESAVCGDKNIDAADELCDGDTVECTTDPGYLGSKTCDDTCGAYNVCVSDLSCGDGVVNGPETCDDASENGNPLKCNAECSAVTAPVCGNDVVEAGEACDADLGNVCVADYDASCTYCTDACAVQTVDGSKCGDATVDTSNEACDGNTQACTVGGYAGTQACNNGCTDFNVCSATESLGDGRRNGPEECDPAGAGHEDDVFTEGWDVCPESLGYAAGKGYMQCSDGLRDMTQCTLCGNGEIDSGEKCDGTDFGTATCEAEGFAGGGDLSCTSSCLIETGQCVAEAPKPDLIVEDAYFVDVEGDKIGTPLGPTPHDGNPMYVLARVRNIGGADSASFSTGFDTIHPSGSRGGGNLRFGPIVASQSVTVHARMDQYHASGRYCLVGAHADNLGEISIGAITESNENNNDFSGSFCIDVLPNALNTTNVTNTTTLNASVTGNRTNTTNTTPADFQPVDAYFVKFDGYRVSGDSPGQRADSNDLVVGKYVFVQAAVRNNGGENSLLGGTSEFTVIYPDGRIASSWVYDIPPSTTFIASGDTKYFTPLTSMLLEQVGNHCFNVKINRGSTGDGPLRGVTTESDYNNNDLANYGCVYVSGSIASSGTTEDTSTETTLTCTDGEVRGWNGDGEYADGAACGENEACDHVEQCDAAQWVAVN
jgi:hypothetical protein